MTVEERRRLHLYETVRTHLGTEAADTLMELLPPMDPSELATRADLALTRAELRRDMADLRVEMADLRTELRTEMAELRTEIRGEMAELRTEMRGEMADLRVEVATLLREQTNRLVAFVVPTVLTGIGLSVAVTQLTT